MMQWSMVFLIVAVIAGLLGFTSIAGAALGSAKVLFLIFLMLFAASLFWG
jgi:uncharacterized membrane protein YtjA (UPF0391 family)